MNARETRHLILRDCSESKKPKEESINRISINFSNKSETSKKSGPPSDLSKNNLNLPLLSN